MKIGFEQFLIEGDIVTDDWEGDPEVPNGVRHYPPYVSDIKVSLMPQTCSEEDDCAIDFTQYLNDDGVQFFAALLLEQRGGTDERA
jgi:hypothetical protein